MSLKSLVRVATDTSKIGDTPANYVYVNPLDFGAKPITEAPGFDSAPAFQRAIDFAHSNGIGVVEFDGEYLWASNAGGYFDTPGDDGTVYPGWVGVNGDVNLPPETTFKIPVCVRLPSGIALRGKNSETSKVVGPWAIDSSPIDITQLAGILITAGSKYQGTVRYTLEDFTLRGFMIGRIGEGTIERSSDSIRIERCGITGLFQGFERHENTNPHYRENYAPDVYGGWWLQRNDTRANPARLPPYPATDVWSLGWTDFMSTQSLVWEGRVTSWGSRHEAIDEFFDTYFFKSSNSAKYSAGGRLSNNSDGSPAIMPTYVGICGRARVILSRYGRGVSSVDIGMLKVLGCHRTPLHYDKGLSLGGCTVRAAYLERVGLINLANSSTVDSNKFGIGNKDPYRSAGYGIGFTGSNIVPVQDAVISSGVVPTPLTNAYALTCKGGLRLDVQRGNTAEAQNSDYINCTRYDRATGEFSLDLQVTQSKVFSKNPVVFGVTNEEGFSYRTGTFSPVLKSNGVVHPVTGSAVGRYKQVGAMLFFSVLLFNGSGAVVFNPGDVTIEGFPFSLAYNAAYGIDIAAFNNTAPGTQLIARMSDSTLTFYKDVAGTKLSGAECNAGTIGNTLISLSGWFMF